MPTVAIIHWAINELLYLIIKPSRAVDDVIAYDDKLSILPVASQFCAVYAVELLSNLPTT